MKPASPFRYPGGKSVLTNLLMQIRALNGLGGHSVAEPFAGGAGAAISMLFLEEASEIFLNDLDTAIHDAWWCILKKPASFVGLVKNARLSIGEWKKQRAVYRRGGRESRLRRGFAAFYLNRCNRSGIVMNGGPIGGMEQQGKWKLDARFNRLELASRCERIGEYADRIHLSQMDGRAFVKSRDPRSTFFFIDPPYFVKGESLYLNSLTPAYHLALAKQLRTMRDSRWVVTYDDCPEIRQMYRGWARIIPYTLDYSASKRERGREVLIVPRSVRLPKSQMSLAVGWNA